MRWERCSVAACTGPQWSGRPGAARQPARRWIRIPARCLRGHRAVEVALPIVAAVRISASRPWPNRTTARRGPSRHGGGPAPPARHHGASLPAERLGVVAPSGPFLCAAPIMKSVTKNRHYVSRSPGCGILLLVLRLLGRSHDESVRLAGRAQAGPIRQGRPQSRDAWPGRALGRALGRATTLALLGP